MTIAACPPSSQPTRGIVVYNDAEFKAAYPTFTTLSSGVLAADFDTATLFLNNSCCSVVQDAPTRQRLLYMLTAHIAALLQGESGKPPSGIVGRIDKAAEGTVSVSAAYVNDMSMSEAYFSQTPYGAMFWVATAGYRAFYYVPPPANACIGRSPGFYGPGYPPGSGCC